MLLGACGENQVILGAGYKYVQLDGSNHAISDIDNRMVVEPNVTRYKVIEPYIVGERKDANIDERLSKRFGYFILDMQSKQLIEGLNDTAFADALRMRNLPAKQF